MLEADRLAFEPCGCRFDIPTGVWTNRCPQHQNAGAGAQSPVHTASARPAPSGLFSPRSVRFVVFGRARPQAQNRTMPLMRKGPDGIKVPVMRTLPNGTQVPVTIHPNPKETVNWRSDVKSAALAAFDGSSGGLLKGPLRMDVVIYVERPKSMVWKTRPMPPVATTSGPDRSNVMKSLEDALQGVVYRNDNQLADGRVQKLHCAGPGYGDERPRTEVSIEEMEP